MLLFRILIFSLYFLAYCNVNAGSDGLIQTSPSNPGHGSTTMLVSTIDGYLIAVDVDTGKTKWRYKEGPLFESPKSVQEDFSFIPNPQNGELYLINGRRLAKLPFKIQALVKAAPCRSSDGILYSGNKKDIWIAINPDTGIHEETIPPQTSKSCPVGHPETIFIGRTEYILSMADSKRPGRQWNATFVDYSSHLLPIDKTYSYVHYHSTTDGRILTVDSTTNEIVWKRDFGSIVVNTYLLKQDGMHRLPSSALGIHTFDNIIKNPATLLNSGARAGPSESRFPETVFIGDSEFGLYAVNSIIDTNVDGRLLNSLSPLLIDGPKDENGQIVITADGENQPGHLRSTVSGLLLLGHHEPPSIIPRPLITTDSSHYPYPFITLLDHEDPSRLDKSKVSPSINDDWGLSAILLHLCQKYPTTVGIIAGSVIILIMIVIYLYGRHNAIMGLLANKSEMLSLSHVSKTSRGSSRRATGLLTDDESSTGGYFNVGKLRYHTEHVLGKGCEGTKVFKGTFDGRDVAVKRVVLDQVKLIDREIELLRKSDTHRNVIRYFCSETDDHFFYIALELCECTLNDYVRNRTTRSRYNIEDREILRQATDGLSHLHSINIMHRDLKPQNLLLASDGKGRVRVLISDFGLCKQVKVGHTSVSKVSGLAGTDGWIAPEVLRSDAPSVTYAVDVFSLGCIFYFVIADGKHPFGEPFRRQDNILEGIFNLEHLTTNSDYVALNVIEKMIEFEPFKRPPVHAVANHPIFWSKDRQLQFFMDVSDRIEKEELSSSVVTNLERNNYVVVSGNWRNMISKPLQENLRQYRSYRHDSVRDLLRAMRNKKHHYRELPDDLRESLGSIPDGYVTYFTSRFPLLLIHTFKAMAFCADESIFQTYYPEESKSFCGRLLRDEIADDFTSVNGSPRRQFQDRTVSTPSKFVRNSPLNEVDRTNWRESPPVVDYGVPPGLDPPKPRRRRRRKAPFSALSTTLEDNSGESDVERLNE